MGDQDLFDVGGFDLFFIDGSMHFALDVSQYMENSFFVEDIFSLHGLGQIAQKLKQIRVFVLVGFFDD